MEKEITNVGDIKLIGIRTRTCTSNEYNPLTSKIGPLIGRYWNEKIADNIPNRKNPGILFVGYSDYSSNYMGHYNYLIGEEVTSFEKVPEGMETLIIPEGSYVKFTNKPGPIPQVIISTWQHIWQLEEAQQLGGKRRYVADFERYDERAKDPLKTVLDVYIGLRSETA